MSTAPNSTSVVALTVRIGDDPSPRRFVGRFAWALSELIAAGERGITSFERPAPRLSHYIFRLRRDGVPIETVPEPHEGAYRGSHGRYFLRAPVQAIEEIRQ